MNQLSWYLSAQPNCAVYLVIMPRNEKLYDLPESVVLHEPRFCHGQHTRAVFIIKILKNLRAELKGIRPDVVLSFGGKYYDFVTLAALGFGLRSFVSDRCHPSTSRN